MLRRGDGRNYRTRPGTPAAPQQPAAVDRQQQRRDDLDAVPVAPLSADVPIGVGALSYVGTLAISINTDAAVTDIDVLAHGIERGFTDFAVAAR
jgi:hypothetical protein